MKSERWAKTPEDSVALSRELQQEGPGEGKGEGTGERWYPGIAVPGAAKSICSSVSSAGQSGGGHGASAGEPLEGVVKKAGFMLYILSAC